jgi:hypothetical protein
MPSARLKLVKLAAPSAAASLSPFGRKKNTCASSCFAHPVNSSILECDSANTARGGEAGSKHAERLALAALDFASIDFATIDFAAIDRIPLPPQLHYFSKKSNWLCHYRRWLKQSKAVWLQRLHRQHSIFDFFTAEQALGRGKPHKAANTRASKPPSNQKLKNATLEAYGARAGTFKSKGC